MWKGRHKLFTNLSTLLLLKSTLWWRVLASKELLRWSSINFTTLQWGLQKAYNYPDIIKRHISKLLHQSSSKIGGLCILTLENLKNSLWLEMTRPEINPMPQVISIKVDATKVLTMDHQQQIIIRFKLMDLNLLSLFSRIAMYLEREMAIRVLA